MRKVFTFLLAVTLIFSLVTPAFAATVSLESESTAVAAGEQVVVKLTQSEAVDGITAIKYYVYYDNTLFELTSSEPGKNITFDKPEQITRVSTRSLTIWTPLLMVSPLKLVSLRP